MYPCTEEIIQLVEGHLLKCGSGLLGEKEKCKRQGEAPEGDLAASHALAWVCKDNFMYNKQEANYQEKRHT